MPSLNLLVLKKGTEKYIFFYDNDSFRALLSTLLRYAKDSSLSFTSGDARALAVAALDARLSSRS
jgi:hypothetical protein